jgi:hypothetical protein
MVLKVVIIEYLQHKKDIDTKRNEKKSHQMIRIPFFKFFLRFVFYFLYIYIYILKIVGRKINNPIKVINHNSVWHGHTSTLCKLMLGHGLITNQLQGYETLRFPIDALQVYTRRDME